MTKKTKASSSKPRKRILYVGIDLSFNATGICVSDKKFKRVTTGLISSRKGDSLFNRVQYISQEIRHYIAAQVDERTTIKCIGIEQLSYGSKGQRGAQIAYLHYRVRLDLMEWFVKRFKKDCPLYTVPATTLKKWVTNNGRAQKNLMMKETFKRWGFDTDDDNICDAYCVCRYVVEKQVFKKPPELEKVM